MPALPAKVFCLLFYGATLVSLSGVMPEWLTAVLQIGTALLFFVHALEVALCFKYVRMYEGPLLVSVLLTLLFGFVHWMPYKKRAEQAATQ